MKSGWMGPGRVVLGEVLPHRAGSGDHEPGRRHIIWVLVGSRLFRCSVYSVRMATTQEVEPTALRDVAVKPQRIEDLLPRGEYTDISGSIPGEDELESEASPKIDRAPAPARSCSSAKAARLGIPTNTFRRMVRASLPIIFFNVLFWVNREAGPPQRTRWMTEYHIV